MKKIIISTIVFITVIFISSSITLAADENMTFSYQLLVDGQEVKEVKTGDIITITLRLKRTDAANMYTMYGMQDEIRYDKNFFELVENSSVLNEGIIASNIDTTERYREFYMNYISMSGGTKWEPDMLIGSIQLKVIGTSGVSKITHQDYLVSWQDGSGSYVCDANEVTVILSTDCTVSFESNGGSQVPEQKVQYGEKIVPPENPERENLYFSGWYTDIDLTDEWDFEEDTVEGNMSLYAKWSDTLQENIYNIGWILLLILIGIIYGIYKKSKGRKNKYGKET